MSERHEGMDFGICSFGLLSLLISTLRNLDQICPTSFSASIFFLQFIGCLSPWLNWEHQTTLPCSGLPVWVPSSVAKFPLEYNYNSIKHVRLGIILLTQFRIGLNETQLLLTKYFMFYYTQGCEQCENTGAQTNHVYHFTYRKKNPLSLRYWCA